MEKSSLHLGNCYRVLCDCCLWYMVIDMKRFAFTLMVLLLASVGWGETSKITAPPTISMSGPNSSDTVHFGGLQDWNDLKLTTEWIGGIVSEGPSRIDPVGWPNEEFYRDDIEIGLRSDGVVVWRKKEK
jgi:hypothetical protein